MNMKTATFTLVVCASWIFASAGKQEDKISYEQQNPLEESPSLKETLHAGINKKRWFGLPPLILIGKNYRKAVDQHQKTDLELAMETTRLEELNKIIEAEKIDETTASAKLSKWQKKLLSDFSKTKKKVDNLSVKSAVTKTLADKLKTPSNTSVKSEAQIADRTKKLLKSLDDQRKINLELALVTKKLEELKKQKESEQVMISTAPIKLTSWQKNLLNDINKTKEKRGDLTVAAAVIKTKVDQLKKQLSEVGGSLDNISIMSTKFKKQINEKIHKAEVNLSNINMELGLVSKKLSDLENKKEADKIDSLEKDLTREQKYLLNDIEKAKEKKYALNLKAALESTLIDQLKLQLNSNTNTSSDKSSSDAKTSDK